MKKTILSLALLFISAGMAIMSCKKNNTAPSDVMFYLSTSCGAGPETIAINGLSKQLTYVFPSGTVPQCSQANTASFELPAGTYTYTVTDSAGTRPGTLTATGNTCTVINVACDSFSASVQSIISQANINSLEADGMTIHGGTTPPANLDGIYLMSPDILLYDATYDFALGAQFADYKYMFYNQTGSAIDLALTDVSIPGSDSASGIGAYISGTGNDFTIFGQLNGSAGSVSYTEVFILSGIITSTGIDSLEYAFMYTSKTGDYNNALIPVDAARIFYDGDYFSGLSSTFRLSQGRQKSGLSLPMFGRKKK